MIPVYQTISGGPNEVPSLRGNCYTAAMASVLELRIEEVPHFVAIEGDAWWDAVQGFVGQFGLEVAWLDVDDQPEYKAYRPKGYWIASVKSTRGDWNHSVVMQGDVLVHDPWPSAGRLTTFDPERLVLIEWFTATDPAAAVRGRRAELPPFAGTFKPGGVVPKLAA